MSATDRAYRLLLILALVCLSWLTMQAVHELGHCLHAWVSGGSVWRVVLNPLVFSVTYYRRNPHPLFVVWGGAVWGCLLPLGAFALVRAVRPSLAYLFRFFAGFCLVVNGVYLGGDAFLKVADGGDLLRHGSPQWVPVAFGVVASVAGLWLWHGLARSFGLGRDGRPVDRRAALGVATALAIVVAAELLLFPAK